MPSTLPRTVRQAIGDEAAEDFAHWYERESVAREEYREVLSRLDVLEHDVKGIGSRLDRIEERIDGGFHGINARFDSVQQTMVRAMYWMVAALVGFATIISVLLAIAEFA